MLIQVTKEDIENGVQRNCEKCPLARAISRAFGKPIRVGAYLAQFFGAGLGESTDLPPNALAFRKAFDAGKPVQPFEFEIEPGKLNPDAS